MVGKSDEVFGLNTGRVKAVAQGRARENSLGMVAAGRDNWFVAAGERAARDGLLHASDQGDQPDETGCWAEARATTAQTAEVGMKGKQDEETTRHNSRTPRDLARWRRWLLPIVDPPPKFVTPLV